MRTEPHKNTAWGPPQQAKVIAPGIIQYSTASHGGIWLDKDRRVQMPFGLKHASTWAGGNWYEEDNDAALVVLSFPELFSPFNCEQALTEAARCTQRNTDTPAEPPYWAWSLEDYLSTPQGRLCRARADSLTQ